MPGEEKPKLSGTAALVAIAAAQAPGLRVRRTIPGGVGTITEDAVTRRNADAKHRADNLKVKVTDLQIEIDTFKNKRDRATTALCGERDQLASDLEGISKQLEAARTQKETLEGEIANAHQIIRLLLNEVKETITVAIELNARKAITQDHAAANEQHISWAASQDQPKIDQLTVKRDKLITRLYHLQNLHPGIFPEKVESENV